MTSEGSGTGQEREDQAIAWLVRLNSGEASVEDWRAHEAWLADPANLAEYSRVEDLWAELGDRAEALTRGLDAASVVVPFVPRRRRMPVARGGLRWAAAAAVALAAVGGAYGVLASRPTIYQTAAGELRPITLADGSRIELNGGSRLSVRFDAAARRVSLGDAEAQFDVTHDAARPFLISAGAQRIRVVGTAFDVASHGGELVVTVRRGVIEVARRGPSGALADVARVPAGFQLSRADAGGATVIKAVDPDDAFAWREHRLVYHAAPMRQVANDLSRAFRVPIEVRGTAGDLAFSGVLVLDDENAVVRRLQGFLPIDVDRSQSAIVLSSRP